VQLAHLLFGDRDAGGEIVIGGVGPLHQLEGGGGDAKDLHRLTDHLRPDPIAPDDRDAMHQGPAAWPRA
jgi:hypothetical protein